MNRKNIAIATAVFVAALGGAWFGLPNDAQTSVKEVLGITQAPQVAQTPGPSKTLDEVLATWGKDTRTVINGHSVPPEPDPALNRATLAGVDSDNNGIRDDLDRYIAENFGNDPKYQDVVIFEQAETRAILNPTKENVHKMLSEVGCVAPFSGGAEVDVMLKKLSALTRKANSVGGRGGAYARAYAGAGLVSCERKR